MSSKLRKLDSPFSLAFALEDVVLLKQSWISDEDEHCIKLQNIIECCTNGKIQLAIFKEFVVFARKSEKSQLRQAVPLICDMFIYCVSRHPLRRSIVSFFQGCPCQLSEVVVEILNSKLEIYLESKRNIERKDVELISSLMENFKLGDEVIRTSYHLVLNYLLTAYSTFRTILRNGESVIIQNDMMANCLATLKTIIAVLQKSNLHIIPKDCPPNNIETNDIELLIAICTLSKDSAGDSVLTLECICACAMLIPSVIFQMSEDKIMNLLDCLCEKLKDNRKCIKVDLDDVLMKNIADGVREYIFVSESSRLSMLHACLVKLPYTCKECSIANTFLQEVIKITLTSTNKHVLVLGFKTISIWAGKLSEERLHMIEQVEEINHLILHLFQFVNHPVDTIRHNVIEALELTLKYLKTCNEFSMINWLCENYLTSNFRSRADFMIAKVLGKFTCVHNFVVAHTELPRNILRKIMIADFSVHACNLYAALSHQHFNEIEMTTDKTINHWIETWVNNLQYFVNDDGYEEVKKGIVEYIVPSLIKSFPDLWNHYTEYMMTSDLSTSRFCVLLLRSYRSMKNFDATSRLKFPEGSHIDMWKMLMPMQHMHKFCTHIDEQVRLDVLSLICSSAKTTEPVDENDLKLLKYFCHYNRTSDMPSFRQLVIVNFKKLLLRIFSYTYQLEQTSSPDDVFTIFINFFEWFINYCMDNLYLNGAPYSQLSLSLDLLNLVSLIFKENSNSYLVNSLEFDHEKCVAYTRTLIRLFEDTYEPNKLTAYNILKSNAKFCAPPTLEEQKSILADVLIRLHSPQPDVSSVAAYLVAYLSHSVSSTQASKLFELSKGKYFNSASHTVFYLLDWLLTILREQFVEVRDSLYKGARTSPIHGTLFCLRTLFALEKLSSSHHLVKQRPIEFKTFLLDLIDLFINIVNLVSNYVSSSAPEGNLCDASLAEIFQQLDLNIESANVEIESHIARMILVCCWRSMKEVSLLLGNIVTEFTDSYSPEKTDEILPRQVLTKVWHMFTDILLRSKHAGAYELAALGFIKLCHVFWHSCDDILKEIPQKAVSSLVGELCSSEPFEKGQVTRRSGGLPFYLKALCTTEPIVSCKGLFKFLMSSLLRICNKNCGSDDVSKLVVSLNIMRAFFKDASLAEDVHEYVSDGVKISVKGISSSLWGIRNSSTLLFSALIQRMFGVKKFQMTGREFFSRYPTLYGFLLEEVHQICQLMLRGNINLHPSLFPMLLLLSNLYPSSVQGSETLMGLGKFIPLVLRCGHSNVYKARTMAARALVPLVSKDKTQVAILQVIENLKSLSKVGGNVLHSNYLQIRELLTSFLRESAFHRLDDSIIIFLLRVDNLIESDGEYFSKSVAMEILCLLVKHITKQEHLDECEKSYFTIINVILNNAHSNNAIPGYILFLSHASRFICHYVETKSCDQNNGTEQLISLIQLGIEDVTSSILDFIASENKMEFTKDHVKRMCKILVKMDTSDMMFEKCVNAIVQMLLSSSQHGFDENFIVEVWSILPLTSTMIRDDLRECIVNFIGVVFRKAQSVNEHLEMQAWKFLHESSLDINSTDVRAKVALTLQFTRFDEKLRSTSGFVYRYFHCCINLLRDVDTQVRSIMARSLHNIVETNANVIADTFFIPHPNFAMNHYLREQLLSQLTLDAENCLLFILSLILQTDFYEICEGDLYAEKDNKQFAEDRNYVDGLVSKFVVFEDSKCNPYFDHPFVCKFLLNIFEISKSNGDLVKNPCRRIQSIIDASNMNYDVYLKKFILLLTE